jgi:hypothetical protein
MNGTSANTVTYVKNVTIPTESMRLALGAHSTKTQLKAPKLTLASLHLRLHGTVDMFKPKSGRLRSLMRPVRTPVTANHDPFLAARRI